VERVRVVTAVLAALLLLQIIRSVRREHIRVEYSMAWFAAGVLLLTLSLSDTVLGWLTRLLGVDDASLVLLVVAGVLFLFTFFRFSVVVSGLKDHNIVLAQKVGILEWEVKRQASELKHLREEKRARPGAGASPGAGG
jgi:hypothetical protein